MKVWVLANLLDVVALNVLGVYDSLEKAIAKRDELNKNAAASVNIIRCFDVNKFEDCTIENFEKWE